MDRIHQAQGCHCPALGDGDISGNRDKDISKEII